MERYRQLCNRRGSDWWSIVFGYPVARCVLAVVAPFSWVTPTRITLLGFAVKALAIGALLLGGAGWLVTAAVLLQVAQVFDSMDGTLARHRGASSALGAYLDKVLDAVTLLALLLVVGVRAQAETGNAALVLFAAVAAGAFLVGSYALWVSRACAPPPSLDLAGGAKVPSWGAILREWLLGWPRIVLFQEADLYFWVALGALLGRWEWLCYGLLVTQTLKATMALVWYGRRVARA